MHTISHRLAEYLEREGILERDEENSYLNLEEGTEDPMRQVLGCSVRYRIAIGQQQGPEVFTLQGYVLCVDQQYLSDDEPANPAEGNLLALGKGLYRSEIQADESRQHDLGVLPIGYSPESAATARPQCLGEFMSMLYLFGCIHCSGE